MKRLAVLALVAAALAVQAAQAGAATPKPPTMAQFSALQKQVKALQTQVKTLQTQVKTLQKWVPPSCTTQTCGTLEQVSGLAALAYEASICETAVIADEFQATWNVVDQLSAATQAGKTYFGPQTSISDANACAALQITRPSGIPPTVAVFSSLVTLLTG
jgi:hypothetical protein